VLIKPNERLCRSCAEKRAGWDLFEQNSGISSTKKSDIT